MTIEAARSVPRVLDLERTRGPFADARTLPGAVYTSGEVLQLEQRGLFAREWLCVGREVDIPAAGDYFLKEIAGDSIIVLRGADGAVRAFYNVCRHRGSRLLDEPRGRGLARVLCPYHSWSYHLDGSLQNAPRMDEGFCKAEFGLVPVRIGVHEGFIFVNLDDGAQPLERYLADLPDLARFRMPELVCGRRIEYDVAANWKLICENYSECYHCAGAHPQLARISEQISRGERGQEIGACFNGGPMRLREGVETMSMSGRSTLPTIPGLSLDDCRYVHYYVIYPNMLLSPHPDYVLVHTAWPVTPERTHVVCEWLFTAAAVGAPDFDPSDVVQFWDTTNRQDWALCERAQAGVRSRGFRPGPYQSSEDCVHIFDRWYADRLAELL
ncbi:MAG: aromatic ring-hydroxylating dioxygenase subunit alpha [Steroidobacteraceae bacterium]|nr:aromatic ring-hydroxylating dioxygenase subunit alpha [Steroidobacteraceae bacterium]MCW5572957.1 aromatic ring-hydroxylating dioxygenase subunit alpha [Steroidobacteraceae bacterium]